MSSIAPSRQPREGRGHLLQPANNPLRLSPGLALTVAILGVAVATLAPFHFEADPVLLSGGPAGLAAAVVRGNSGVDDALNNVLLFLPVGLLISATLAGRTRGALAHLAAVAVAALALSLAIELAQLFLPTREAALIDVATNTSGALLGAFVHNLALRSTRSARSLLVGLVCYLAIALTYAVTIQPTVRLDSWDPGYRLFIGNEGNNRRPWRGSVTEVRAADVALSPQAARELLAGGKVSAFEARRVFDYRLDETVSLADRADRSPALVWRKGQPSPHQGTGVWLDGVRSLGSAAPMHEAIAAIRSSSAFTLVATVASASPDQDGPARIISLSHNNDLRNLTLGQEGTNLVVRLRTDSNGPNGIHQQLVVPGLLADDRPHRLVLTYAGARLTLYVDQRPAATLVLDPEVNLLRLLLGGELRALLERLPGTAVNAASYTLYYLLVFVPLGIALACAAALRGGRAAWVPAAFGAGALPILLELALAGAGERSLRPVPALVGSALTVAALLAARARSRHWRRPHTADTGGCRCQS